MYLCSLLRRKSKSFEWKSEKLRIRFFRGGGEYREMNFDQFYKSKYKFLRTRAKSKASFEPKTTWMQF